MIINVIKSDFIQARKNRDTKKSSFYSWIIGQIENSTDSKVYSDDVVLPILQNLKKKLAEANEQSEVDIINMYLPELLSDFEIRAILADVDGGMKEKMAYLKENFPFKYDGKLASMIAKET